jgi:hypothetical protein
MLHPLVAQLHFTRSEWQRALEGISNADAGRRGCVPDFRKSGQTRGDSGGYPPRPPVLTQILGRTLPRRISTINCCMLGRIFQQTFIDTYGKVAFVKLYDRKNALVAAELLNDRVIPFFEQQQVPCWSRERNRRFMPTTIVCSPTGSETFNPIPLMLVGQLARA